ncbi:helix-turn-helix transcriptional regulator [Verrucomicrobium sp. GAS474]|uniref:helix-turn-helix domain-containing protein n=1 Tax=Verrucomicrobium sp. GAS474 TaxID=1882831 RepID=UPI000B83060A|nr:helix-turn-helix transcriptional regulator [Verrucomicrobium sp. GAS474]
MSTPAERRQQATKFGRNLKRLRAGAGLTQEGLAERADMSAVYVRQVELGMRLPSVAIAKALRKGLGVSWDDLMSF